jgi:thiol:disulfide interchange protein DsbC
MKVVSYEMAAGLWQVLYEAGPAQRNVIYASLNFDKIFYGQFIGKDGKNYTRHYILKHAGTIDTSLIPSNDAAFVMGDMDARNKLFVFSDLECPYCARLHFELKNFLAEHGDYAIYVMLSPLPTHPKAEDKSKAVHCLKSPSEKEIMVDILFKSLLDSQKVKFQPAAKCDTSGLDRIKHFTQNVLKAKGAPTMVLPDGRVIEGFLAKNDIEDILSYKPPQKEKKDNAPKQSSPQERQNVPSSNTGKTNSWKAIDTSKIPTHEAVAVLGNESAPNKLFVFNDLDSRSCANLYFDLKRLLSSRNDYAAYVMLSATSERGEQKSKVVYSLRSRGERAAMTETFLKNILDKKELDIVPSPGRDISGLQKVKRYVKDVLKAKGAPTIVLADGRVIDGKPTTKDLEDIIGSGSPRKSSEKPAKREDLKDLEDVLSKRTSQKPFDRIAKEGAFNE